ncbi:MAG: SRPBCC family protein [Bacteroidota bacterium]
MNTLIEKNFDIEAPIDLVWKSLANPEEIVGCVPGASITEKIDESNYKGAVVTKFGPIKASYAGDIEIVELDEANRKMVLKGRGLDSKGKGSADMVMNGLLSEEGGKTHVKFSMDITIVGMLAQFGSRLINDVSDQLLNQFVKNFRAQLAEAAPATAPTEAAPVAAMATATTEAAPTTETVEKTKPNPASTFEKATPKRPPSNDDDNALDAGSLFGTVIKSLLNSLLDFIRSLFGGGKAK